MEIRPRGGIDVALTILSKRGIVHALGILVKKSSTSSPAFVPRSDNRLGNKSIN